MTGPKFFSNKMLINDKLISSHVKKDTKTAKVFLDNFDHLYNENFKDLDKNKGLEDMLLYLNSAIKHINYIKGLIILRGSPIGDNLTI